MIEINNLEKRLSPDFCIRIPSLEISRGERVAIIGPNGSGKSTLLKLIAGIIKPDVGVINIHAEKSEIGYEPQSPFIFKGSAEKNILLNVSKNSNTDKLIETCNLSSLRKKNARLLSGGEKQRVCFARMLAGCYPLLMMDEPLSATDINTCRMLENTLISHCKENNTTLVITTHTPSQAQALATKILIMNNGEIAEYSDVTSLTEPESEFGKEFLSLWKI